VSIRFTPELVAILGDCECRDFDADRDANWIAVDR
jgi:hypothetical protein